ncbi:KOW domain-containing RNA-binding protein [Oceanirhabdus sp. W0125-5]|uniref:KOW domain-containing RNA-binding protein n=1 Tax=Oceanirhabdus sp. W0125-5 TaxID=2999116 RepID=UPI0022F306AB|nr:KOW domain-containing RNA-binding protein [Oceanirhabdus sp. W0125-5]WBW98015.1 KOW domain-containing RNA-binding protein [Oceanirhabdus sp. W0125-5]
MERKNLIGRIVYSKAGRDKDKYFMILDVLNEEFVYLVDGDLRRLERPKKKKIKHLIFTDKICDEVKDIILKGKRLNDATVRKAIGQKIANKEV